MGAMTAACIRLVKSRNVDACMRYYIKRGGNSFGLDPADGPLVLILFYTSWDHAHDDDKIYSVNKAALDKIDAEDQNKGLSSPFRYLLYAFPHQDAMASYGPESHEQLRAVSHKHDPDGFFQTVGAGLFKLWW